MASEIPRTPKTFKCDGGGYAAAGFGKDAHPHMHPAARPHTTPGTQVANHPLLRGFYLLLEGRKRHAWRGRCCRMGVSAMRWKAGAQRRSGPPVPEHPTPSPKKAAGRGLFKKTFCGEEISFLHMKKKKSSNSFLCSAQTTFPAAINQPPRSPLARGWRHSGTIPTGFGRSFYFGEICKIIFINNIRNHSCKNPVCKTGAVRGRFPEARLPKILLV